MSDAKWNEQIQQYPIKSCGRLDMATYLPGDVEVGRVTSDRIRYVYFEDGTEVVCIGSLCDHVAYRASTHAELEAENAALHEEIDGRDVTLRGKIAENEALQQRVADIVSAWGRSDGGAGGVEDIDAAICAAKDATNE